MMKRIIALLFTMALVNTMEAQIGIKMPKEEPARRRFYAGRSKDTLRPTGMPVAKPDTITKRKMPVAKPSGNVQYK